ncbi:hypothetical protein O7626_40950 [Micromonospora sp. WMMD1102]|uniref:hypothetical protein n=1 Tax=Micromonospora sp. WMMD1102 TaxID=3016105 RepID=UPI002415885C|nr:hypothetical protein [Micromonospora sp. WMMD1102]MDG4785699.1 hypothetical protein [Micromonospora sp. WMMD1102]MDG4792174.1 hypothetical protein [Micromonospora sp. WMMD1102]
MARTFHKRVFGVGLAVLTATAMSSGPAFAGTAGAQSEATVQRCVLTLGERPAGSLYNTIKSYECFTASQDRRRVPAGMVEFYKGSDFRGDVLEIDPGGGPCDSSGWGIRQMPSGWDNQISSYYTATWSQCTRTQAFDLANYGGYSQTYGGTVPWVGSSLNDKITSFRWWKG